MTAWPDATAIAAPAPEETPEEYKARRDGLIRNWLGAKASAVASVDLERTLRGDVTKVAFPNPTKGTQRIPLGNGYQLKLVYKLNHTLGDKDKTDDAGEKVKIATQVQELEAAVIEKHGALGEALITRLIKWTPELSVTEYDKLDKSNNVEADIAAMISEILTITPATPTLEFEEPKSAK